MQGMPIGIVGATRPHLNPLSRQVDGEKSEFFFYLHKSSATRSTVKTLKYLNWLSPFDGCSDIRLPKEVLT